MKTIKLKEIFAVLFLLLPVFLISFFFMNSKFILLDDHEIYRLYFKEINIFTAILDDWKNLYRFRPFYWLVRQVESIFFGINPFFWYSTSLVFFSTTIISLYLFFKNIGYKSFLAVIFTWASVLGYQSIASWMALGIQEGLGLCLFSCSIYQLSLFGLDRIMKNFCLSVIFFFLSFLVKESFFFLIPFVVIIILWQEKYFTRSFFIKSLAFSSGSIFMIPIIMIQSWRSYKWRMISNNFNQFDFLKTDNMLNFLALIKENYHLVLTFTFFIISGVFLVVANRRNSKKIILIFTFLLCSLGISAQFLIYSFTEYVAPHYIQPISMIIVLSLSFILKYYSYKAKFVYGLLISLVLPITFFNSIRYANGHNFQSRALYEIEQQVIQSNKTDLILVGHRSRDHEKLFSFYKRISYQSPNKTIYFYHYDNLNKNKNDNRFDVVEDTTMLNVNSNQLNNYPMIVNISSNGFNDEYNFMTTKLLTKPILKNINYDSTWYVEAPSLVLK
ncbi:hypothetical protein KKD03_04035 [Patescibacteria group bacterium]|nr:hypothetical protein [Patescibacteria group bacterium]